MKITDIELQPSNTSVVAHLQDRLREAWEIDHDRSEVHDLLDAIRLCLKANGYQDLHWDKGIKAWTAVTVIAPKSSSTNPDV